MIRTFETDSGRWVVSKRGYGWLPGIYESESVARQAASFPVEVLTGLGRIYRIDGEDRAVTADDLLLINGLIACSLCGGQFTVEQLAPHDGSFESDVCRPCALLHIDGLDGAGKLEP
jgi:hypothetical protein